MSAQPSPDRAAAMAALGAILDRLSEPAIIIVQTRGVQLASLRIDPPPPATAPPPPEHPCRRQIRRVLTDAGRRLLLREIMDEFAERGIEFSERTVDRQIADLRREGAVDRDDGASPPGYGLTRQEG